MLESMFFQTLFGVPVFAEAAHLFAYFVPIVPYGRDFFIKEIHRNQKRQQQYFRLLLYHSAICIISSSAVNSIFNTFMERSRLHETEFLSALWREGFETRDRGWAVIVLSEKSTYGKDIRKTREIAERTGYMGMYEVVMTDARKTKNPALEKLTLQKEFGLPLREPEKEEQA